MLHALGRPISLPPLLNAALLSSATFYVRGCVNLTPCSLGPLVIVQATSVTEICTVEYSSFVPGMPFHLRNELVVCRVVPLSSIRAINRAIPTLKIDHPWNAACTQSYFENASNLWIFPDICLNATWHSWLKTFIHDKYIRLPYWLVYWYHLMEKQFFSAYR